MADLTQFVVPFVGSEGSGNVFPGVTRPYGMVKLGPDLTSGQANTYSGYLPDGNFTGFSMMHLSGTGGVPMYGVVSQLPVVGDIANPLSDLSIGRMSPDEAEVGYYKAQTSQGVEIDLAATEHAAMYQYTFPEPGGNIVVDLSHRLPSFRGFGLEQQFEGGSMNVEADGRYEGNATYSNGYNMAPPWTIYFCGLFDVSPSEVRVFEGDGDQVESFQPGNAVRSEGRRIGSVLSFDDTSILSRVGISFISTEKACGNVNREMPGSASFSSIVDETKAVWNENILSKVTTTETNLTDLQNLYTSLYVMHQMPSNRTGENPLWQSDEPYWDDIFTFWDLFRCTIPLMQVLQPDAHEQFLRSIVDVWRHEGYLPNARSVNFNGPVQGGTNSDIVLADAYVKGVRGSLNWADAYSAMLKNAEVEPPNNFDPRAPDSSTKEGRGGLSDWTEYGFITPRFSRSVSRGVEYALNDFGLHQVALGEGSDGDADKYWQRSQNWRNHWNANATSLGFQGFLNPRDENGFIPNDPLSCCGYWADPFYQASSWEYSFNPHHDIAQLIEISGGKETFVSRLQTMFEKGVYPDRPDATIYNAGNQVSYSSSYLFHFAGRPDLSTSVSRQIFRSQFSPTPNGLSGNADAGAMQSWLLWNMIGLYPITGQITFLIHSPWFEHLKLDLGNGKELVINSTGGNKDTSIHIQSLKVNGFEWKKSWLTWTDVFANGGTMEFELGPTPDLSYFDADDLPPSPASSASPPNRRRKIPIIETVTPGGGAVTNGQSPQTEAEATAENEVRFDRRLYGLFGLLLVMPIAGGLVLFFWRKRAIRQSEQELLQQNTMAANEAVYDSKLDFSPSACSLDR